MFLKKLLRNKKGAVLIEYGLLIAGIAMVTLAAVSVLGNKTSDMVSTVATVLPGVQADDNQSIQSGQIVETTLGANGAIAVDATAIDANSNTNRLADNLGINGAALEQLVVDAN
jgi:Flp pilus assembly pilin Flp